MLTRRIVLAGAAIGATFAAAYSWLVAPSGAAGTFEFALSDAEWRKRLTAAQYSVLRKSGTERPFTSPLDKEKRAGIFACAGCEQGLFSSKTKFDSGTG